MNRKYYELITIAPKIANPSIMSAGIIVIMASFDMIFPIYTRY
jgi:hypothetical protein